MITQPEGVKRYHSSYDRFLKPSIVNFLAREFPAYFGLMVRENMADALIDLFQKNVPYIANIKHGQMLWNTLDKHTRASSPK